MSTILALVTLCVGLQARAETPDPAVPGTGGGLAPPPVTPSPEVPSASTQAHLLVSAAWSPAGAGTLAWDAGQAWSGTLAGEFDGIARPPLAVTAGVVRGRWGWLGGFGVVRFDDTTIVVSRSRQVTGVVRLEAEGRAWLAPPAADRVAAYGYTSIHGNLPTVSRSDENWTEAEVTDAEDTVRDLVRRIGGAGFGIGAGASWPLAAVNGLPALSLGVRAGVQTHMTRGSTDEDGVFSLVVLPDSALTLEWMR